MASIRAEVAAAFRPAGPLARQIPGFRARDAQLQLADRIAHAIEKQSVLLAEAGTGTGKTFAYLVPALLSGQKVLISTGTKNLQEQLFHRDLPSMTAALASPLQLALLKGRANYLCLFRLEQHVAHVPVAEPQLMQDLTLINKWAAETQTGDIGELTYIAEDSKALPYVTSTTDNCLGKDCPVYEDCHLLKARKKAQAADLVVVNHHLFFADLAIKDTGFGELLPQMDVFVFDEAHQLPDLACDYFGEHVSSRQLLELCRDLDLACKTELRDHPQLRKITDKVAQQVKDWRLQFPVEPERGNWRERSLQPQMQSMMQRLTESMELLYQVLKESLGRSDAVDHCFERLAQNRNRLQKLNDTSKPDVSLWYDTSRLHLTLHLTPLSIAEKFREVVFAGQKSWVFTSATLSVDGGFAHYQQQMGLEQADTLLLDSPFDYQQQALLCVPRYLPEPHQHQAMQQALLNTAIPLIEANQGRCFMLFTSHRMLKWMAEVLPEQIRQPVLVQGQTSKRVLLDKFVQLDDAVLLGTSSFWEGVDVRGDALSLVIIDKLPFASPDDPLLQARMEASSKQGVDPFAAVQLPQAVISLKQGVGRLIRDVTDRGVLVICDNRLVTRPYGEVFLKSLPPMQRSRDLTRTLQFIADKASASKDD
ncbi:ATP-dependent DNA helicase [Alkalimonas sp. NCh-2]|uniref:ATP-dependent DNA helicase n=1 Tax=Alkalimonas sp. NCh-2 TaxID=3144846 RepID=UPI0031F71162